MKFVVLMSTDVEKFLHEDFIDLGYFRPLPAVFQTPLEQLRKKEGLLQTFYKEKSNVFEERKKNFLTENSKPLRHSFLHNLVLAHIGHLTFKHSALV